MFKYEAYKVILAMYNIGIVASDLDPIALTSNTDGLR